MAELRPYQQEILHRQHDLARHHRRLLVVLATGLGKTEIALANIASAVGKGFRVVYLAHREELITQPAERLERRGIGYGVLKAGYREELLAPVQVASVQTLVQRRHLLQQLEAPRLLVYVDEAHRVASGSYRAVLEAWPRAWVVGQTATPYRLDGQGLGEHYDALVEGIAPSEAIAQGWLCEPTVYAAKEPDLTGVRKSHGEFVTAEVEERMAALTGDIVPTWQRLARGLPTLCFAVSRRHSRAIVEAFRSASVPAAHLDGDTDPEERRHVLEGLAGGKYVVVSNVDLLTEGWDGASYARPGQPYVPLQAMIAARPTASMGLWFQMVGRLTRPGKARAVLLDHAGNTQRHGLLRNHHGFGLDGTILGQPVRGRRAPLLRRCPKCAAVWEPAKSRCEECGAELGKPRQVRQRGGELELLDQQDTRRKATQSEKGGKLLQLLQEAKRRGWDQGWASHAFKRLYGHWPAPVALSRALAAVGMRPKPRPDKRLPLPAGADDLL